MPRKQPVTHYALTIDSKHNQFTSYCIPAKAKSLRLFRMTTNVGEMTCENCLKQFERYGTPNVEYMLAKGLRYWTPLDKIRYRRKPALLKRNE